MMLLTCLLLVFDFLLAIPSPSGTHSLIIIYKSQEMARL